MSMADDSPPTANELKTELRKLSKLVSSVSFTGEFIVVFFRSLPKLKPEFMRSDICDYLSERLGVPYSFLREEKKAWVYKAS